MNVIPKPARADNGAFKQPPKKHCIRCGRWCPGGIERHHGKSKGAGGDHTWANRFDLCAICHGRAQRNEQGYLIEDLERCKQEDLYWRQAAAEQIAKKREG